MSRIYFHTPDGEAEVHGSERAYLAQLAGATADTLMQPRRGDYEREWYESITVGGDYIWRPDDRDDRWRSTWESWFKASMSGDALLVRGQEVDTFSLRLNTAIALGSPVLSLAARLHATCEIHGWVEAADAGWLRELIEQGLRGNVLRGGQGWQDVQALCARIESGEQRGPIVTSYSVCESFPNSSASTWQPAPPADPEDPDADQDERWDAYYYLSPEEQWSTGEAWLREHEAERMVRMGPEVASRGFGSGLSAFDLLADRWKARRP